MSWEKNCILFSLIVPFMMAENLAAKKGEKGLFIGSTYYFFDNSTNRDWEKAQAYCKNENGELAKVTGKSLYNILRRLVPVAGSYWIDGTDKPDKSRFVHTEGCTNAELNFNGIPSANLAFKARACLALYKVTDSASSGIEVVSCYNEQIGVICAIPGEKGCSPKNVK